MKQLTTRQAKLIMLFYVCISKIMLLPSLICGKVKQDYFVVISAMFLFELLFLLLILSISSKNPNKTFKQLFEEKYGKIVTKIFYFLIGTLL